jgi:hypothetical protein
MRIEQRHIARAGGSRTIAAVLLLTVAFTACMPELPAYSPNSNTAATARFARAKKAGAELRRIALSRPDAVRQIFEAVIDDEFQNGDTGDGSYFVVPGITRVSCGGWHGTPADCGADDWKEPGFLRIPPTTDADLPLALYVENMRSIPVPALKTSRARVVPEKSIADIFRRGGFWSEFHDAFPDTRGRLNLSIPVFDASGNNAAIYVEFTRNGLWGGGTIYYFVRDGTTWKIRGRKSTWVS